jgi:hypothetical protein
VDVAGPAVPQLVAAVVLAQHGIGPAPQLGQSRVAGVAVQTDPVWGGGPAGGGGVKRVGDGPGQVLEPGGQVHLGAEPGLVEPVVDGVDLAAQVSKLCGQRSQALAQSAGRRFSGRAAHRPTRKPPRLTRTSGLPGAATGQYA